MRPGPQAPEEAGKEQLSLRPLTARPGWGGPAGVGLLSFPRRAPGRELAGWLVWRRGEEDPRGFLVSRAPPDVRKANNRGNAEKQKAIRHGLNRLCRVVPAGRTSGRGQEGG